MQDDQLRRLTNEVLKHRQIWALNIGENFNISLEAWQEFTDALVDTSVSFLYVSEHHLLRTDLKVQMKDAIRKNRRYQPHPRASASLFRLYYFIDLPIHDLRTGLEHLRDLLETNSLAMALILKIHGGP